MYSPTSNSSGMELDPPSYPTTETHIDYEETNLSAQNQEQQQNFTNRHLREQQEFTQPRQHLEQNLQERQLTENLQGQQPQVQELSQQQQDFTNQPLREQQEFTQPQ